MAVITLKNMDLLTVADEKGTRFVGGDQYWYPKEGFIPPGACGAAAASNVMAYLLRSRPGLRAMAEARGLCGLSPNAKGGEAVISREEYLSFMKRIYPYFYPRAGGLMAEVFVSGALEFSQFYDLPITPRRLRVPISRSKRPSFSAVSAFISESLAADCPLAFLILSNGCVQKLDTWHWVTILSLDMEHQSVYIADNGLCFWAELALWLETSIMGGSFVRLEVDASLRNAEQP